MREHTNELQERFSDAAIALMMDEYAQEDGDRLLARYREAAESMPEQMDRDCQKIITTLHKRMLVRSTLRRAARAAACILIILCLSFSLAMSVEAFRVPVINFVLKNAKGLTEITFYQDSDSFSALDRMRMLIFPSIPEGYQFDNEVVNTSSFGGTEAVTSLLIRYRNPEDAVLDILITKAKGSMNFGSQDASVTSMELYGQQTIFVAEGDELRVLWVNDLQGQLYNITGYGTTADDFWLCVHTLAAGTKDAGTDIIF